MILPIGITQDAAGLRCQCGARCSLAERGRFLKRHPGPCARALHERKEFAHQLAQGTRSVQEDSGDLIDEIQRKGKDLTAWEEESIESIAEQWERRGRLTPKQEEILQRIWKERV